MDATEINVRLYLRAGGAGNATNWRRRYCCYRLWAKLLRKRGTPYRCDAIFKFRKVLKRYIRSVTVGNVADALSPPGAIVVPAEHFVKYVVKR